MNVTAFRALLLEDNESHGSRMSVELPRFFGAEGQARIDHR